MIKNSLLYYGYVATKALKKITLRLSVENSSNLYSYCMMICFDDFDSQTG